MKCVICDQTIPLYEIESPFDNGAVYDLNPHTLRKGWMHEYCMRNVLEESKNCKPTNNKFESRFEEWLFKIS